MKKRIILLTTAFIVLLTIGLATACGGNGDFGDLPADTEPPIVSGSHALGNFDFALFSGVTNGARVPNAGYLELDVSRIGAPMGALFTISRDSSATPVAVTREVTAYIAILSFRPPAVLGEYILNGVYGEWSITAEITVVTAILRTVEDLSNIAILGDAQPLNTVPDRDGAYSYTGHFILGNSINATVRTIALGFPQTYAAAANSAAGLNGIFDGRGYTISNAFFGSGGLLGAVSADGIVKNLAITRAISGDGSQFGGVISGAFFGTMDNVLIEATQVGYGINKGLFGFSMFDATITNTILYLPERNLWRNFVFADYMAGTTTLDNVHIFTGMPTNHPNRGVFGNPNAVQAVGNGYHINGFATILPLSSVDAQLFDLSIWDLTGSFAMFRR